MYGSISTTALEFSNSYLDFTRCQRPDGAYYRTSGKCRKGKVSGKREGSPVAGKTPKQPREEVSTKAKPLLSRRAGGQSLDGEKLDYVKLKQRVAAWVKKNGLGDSDDQVPGHDQTHILVQDYLGKSSKALGALMGERTKGGPTVFEEAVVEALQGFSSKPGLNKSIFFQPLLENLLPSPRAWTSYQEATFIEETLKGLSSSQQSIWRRSRKDQTLISFCLH